MSQRCLDAADTGRAATVAPGWEAQLALRFARQGARTVLAERRQRGPLAVQRPLYPEGDVCHLYVLHPPGGLVGGDRLEVVVVVEAAAAALLTTPGATKFYRSLGPRAEQWQSLQIRDGSLEWFPQETILFPGANARMRTQIALHGEARLIGWEIHCLGLPAQGQRFAPGQADLELRVDRDGEPLLWDRLRIRRATDLDGPSGLRGMPVVGTLIATGADAAQLERARAAADAVAGTETLIGISCLQDLLVARVLGRETDRVRGTLTAVWASLRPELLGRPATLPRIWAT